MANDGLWDTRLVVSRDGRSLHYPGSAVRNPAGPDHSPAKEARNARRPFVPMGVNKCQFLGSPDDVGGWCSYFPESEAESFEASSFDTSFNSLVRGYVLSLGTPDSAHTKLNGLCVPNGSLSIRDETCASGWPCLSKSGRVV